MHKNVRTDKGKQKWSQKWLFDSYGAIVYANRNWCLCRNQVDHWKNQGLSLSITCRGWLLHVCKSPWKALGNSVKQILFRLLRTKQVLGLARSNWGHLMQKFLSNVGKWKVNPYTLKREQISYSFFWSFFFCMKVTLCRRFLVCTALVLIKHVCEIY